MTRLEKIIAAHEEMDKLMTKLSKYGAADTEPDWHYQDAVSAALCGELFKDLTCREWEMFDKPGFQAAVKAMNDQTRKVVDLILKAKVSELSEITEWAHKTLWRVF